MLTPDDGKLNVVYPTDKRTIEARRTGGRWLSRSGGGERRLNHGFIGPILPCLDIVDSGALGRLLPEPTMEQFTKNKHEN